MSAIRFALHDLERESDTGSLFYSNAAIARALTDALSTMLKGFIEEYPRRANITCGPLLKTTATKNGQGAFLPVPDDFWILECGLKSGKYVPAQTVTEGVTSEELRTFGKIYIRTGSFAGDADTAVYFRLPPVIQKTTKTLPYWPDVVYNAARQLAIANLLIEEERQAQHRIQFYMNEYERQRSLLN